VSTSRERVRGQHDLTAAVSPIGLVTFDAEDHGVQENHNDETHGCRGSTAEKCCRP
jgi:hypothetical protein